VLFCIYLDGLFLLLEKAKIGCCIGNCYLGALCYADDLTLAPTADAMRTMLKLCEDCVYEHSITFNADKSKCIIFKPLSGTIHDKPFFFSIAGKLIDHTSSWPHLGNIINENEDDHECIAARRIQFIAQVNNVLSTFGKLDPLTKNNLVEF
jgi:hypothetical protein